MLVWLLLLSSAAGQITNDFCVGATNVSNGLSLQSNYASILDNTFSCVSYYDVFFVYYPTCTGVATIAATPTNDSYYVEMGVFLGRSCSGLGDCDDNDDYGSGTRSVSTPVFGPGDKLYFVVGNEYYSDGPFPFVLNITCTPGPVVAGDICANAIPVTGNNVQLNVDSTNAYYGSQGSCNSPDIFLVYNASCTGDVTILAAASSGTAYVQGFFDGGCDKIMNIGSYWGMGCPSGDSGLTMSVVAGRNYYFSVGDASDDATYNVTLTCVAASHPANDRCEGATTASNVISTVGATPSIPYGLCSSYTSDQDVWVTYTATCTGDVVVMFNESYVTAVAFTGPCGAYMMASPCSYGSSFTFPVVNGTNYTINFGSDSDAVIGMNWTCMPVARPANDWCANAMAVTANNSYTVNFTLATTDKYDVCDGNLQQDVYFRYTTCYGENTINAVGVGSSSSSVRLGGFLACGLDPLVCTGSFPFTFFAPAVVQVYFGVGWYYTGETGQVQVNFTCLPSTSSAPTAAPTTTGTTLAPTAAPTTTGTTLAPTAAPTTPGTTLAPTMAGNNTNTTSNSTSAPTMLSGAGIAQLGLATLVCAFAV